MAITSDCTLPSLTPNVPSRKYSAPSGPYHSNVTNYSPHAYSRRNGCLLPMPPNYHEGSCWTLASLCSLNLTSLEIRSRKISVQVTKISLKMDGHWAQEKPYIIEKTWDEWLEFRERIVQRYPETESVLPKLSKTLGFLESIFTNSKRGNNAQSLNVKELNNFLNRLVTKCSKKVIDSSVVQNFFQTEEMRAGVYQVEYVDDDDPAIPAASDISAREEANFIASHLQAFRFPESNAVQPQVPSNAHHNLPLCEMAVGPDVEMTLNEKVSPRFRAKRPTEPMTVINELMPPPALAQEPQNISWSNTKGTPKSRNLMRPNTAAVAPAVPAIPPKRPNTSDCGRQHEAILKHAISGNFKPFSNSIARRPSGNSREGQSQKPSRPQLKEFKSMQDIRATTGSMKNLGRSGRKGFDSSNRNNSIPAVDLNPQIGGIQLRSPSNHWRKHQRSPSECSSSFSSSQLSPISSVLISPTATPLNSTNALLELIFNQRVPHKIAWRRSIDSIGPHLIGVDDPSSLGLIHEPEVVRTFAHETIPLQPIIPPHIMSATQIATSQDSPPTSQRRPSAENGKSDTLTLKVTHPESKTNIILAIQKGFCSLQQIKTKIQNKIKLAADIDLDPDWKIKLIMIDQEEILKKDAFFDWKDTHFIQDDGLKLVELVNLQSLDYSIKKITLRIC